MFTCPRYCSGSLTSPRCFPGYGDLVGECPFELDQIRPYDVKATGNPVILRGMCPFDQFRRTNEHLLRDTPLHRTRPAGSAAHGELQPSIMHTVP